MLSRFLALNLFLACGSIALGKLTSLQQIDLKTFEKMKETERYQIKIAEKHFLDGKFKVALAEYEKFLTLYEKSPGAPYAQLMWSHTMMKLKKPKTALRDGSNQSSTTGPSQTRPPSPPTAWARPTAPWAKSRMLKNPSAS